MTDRDREHYLQGFGFQKGGSVGGMPCLIPTKEPSDEAWMLAWHLFGGQVRIEAGEQRAFRPANQELVSSEIEDLADGILERAVVKSASDIHLEPGEHGLHLRYRLDGHLVAQSDIPRAKRDHLVAHLKIRAGMDIAEKRRPQDGRIRFSAAGKTVDLRVSTLATRHGEKMVLRLLDKAEISLAIDDLGFRSDHLTTVKRLIAAPQGMVLVTGPTGSGKTTTLYSCLMAVRSESLNITTIEDPIEYELDGINQTQVKNEIGITFASSLRTFLRQDPNVIMVGEIRDEEAAKLSMRAALTGHLVLSTLHTNSAAGAIPRLAEMGVPNHLLASCLNLLIAQRLLRRLCLSCKQPIPSEELGLPASPTQASEGNPYSPVGCESCSFTGYRGRLGIYEVLAMDETLRAAVAAGADLAAITKLARDAGMATLAQEATRRAWEGLTSRAEVIKETIQ